MLFIKRSDVCCGLVSDFGNVSREMVELWDEVKKMDMGGMWSELNDVVGLFLCWLYDRWGVDGWVVNNSSVKGWKERWDWWKVWLSGWGLEFDAMYMDMGANYKRGHKRRYVLKYAVSEQMDICLWDFCRKYVDGGYLFNDSGEIVSVVDLDENRTGNEVVFADM